MTEEEKSPRRYPRRQLRGKVTVHFSTRAKFPKFHMVQDCDGLEKVVPEARESRTYSNALELGLDFTGRPCRNCTLESVLLTVLKPHPKKSSDVFFSCTSQPNPLDPAAPLAKYAWGKATFSGSARIVRLSKKLPFELTQAINGPCLYGFTTSDGFEVLSHNLRSYRRDGVTELPSAETVQCLWAFLGDAPPETGAKQNVDPWETAMLLG